MDVKKSERYRTAALTAPFTERRTLGRKLPGRKKLVTPADFGALASILVNQGAISGESGNFLRPKTSKPDVSDEKSFILGFSPPCFFDIHPLA
jgi:hypothetical protein